MIHMHMSDPIPYWEKVIDRTVINSIHCILFSHLAIVLPTKRLNGKEYDAISLRFNKKIHHQCVWF